MSIEILTPAAKARPCLRDFRRWARTADHPLARGVRTLWYASRSAQMPVIPGVHRILWSLWLGGRNLGASLTRALWWTPLLRARLEPGSGRGLYLYGGLPLLLGPVRVQMGDACRMSGQVTITGRVHGIAGSPAPTLTIGRNVDLGWQTTIAVGQRVEIGDDVRLAGRNFLAGYPGHPLNPADRAQGLPDTEDQVGDIVLEPGVWLATGVTVCAGVRIGRGTVVAAGSVVTRDLPANVLAGGVPAKVIRSLPGTDTGGFDHDA